MSRISSRIVLSPIQSAGDGRMQAARHHFPASNRHFTARFRLVLAAGWLWLLAGIPSASEVPRQILDQIENARSSRATACYYLVPFNMHLVNGATSTVPLQVVDAEGAVVSGTVQFSGYDTTLLQISADGYVTALRGEAASEIGTWVSAALDGLYVANTSVVRVLPAAPSATYSRLDTAHTALYYPSVLDGENLGNYVDTYQVNAVDEFAYQIQSGLIGVNPFGGCQQVFEVDLGYDSGPAARVCGISGNPIRLGWGLGANPWSNCFLVPFLPPRSPQWGVMYHELGHNFTWASWVFARGLGIFDYSEGIATAMALVTSGTLLADPESYGLTQATQDSLAYVYNRDRNTFLTDFQNWLDAGADFSSFNPNLVDGIWCHYQDLAGPLFAERFFEALDPAECTGDLMVLLNRVEDAGDPGRHTFFAALVSASAGTDLFLTFRDTYHFPLDESLYYDLSAYFQDPAHPDEYGFLMDGGIADWDGISPAATDPSGDSQCGEGSDLTVFSVACTPKYLYILQQVADGLAGSSLYHFHLDFTAGGTIHHYVLEMQTNSSGGFSRLVNEADWQTIGYPSGIVRAAAEARIPWDLLDSPAELDIVPVTPGPPCDFFAQPVHLVVPLTGDVDGDGQLTATDARVTADCLAGSVQPGTPPFVGRPWAADFDGDGSLTVVDLVILIHILAGQEP